MLFPRVTHLSCSPTGLSVSSLTSGMSYTLLFCHEISNFRGPHRNVTQKDRVLLYFSLTGVSPFAGENDRATALNIRNYNVAFEESMFSDLCKEAKGFVIKLLVVDRL